MRIPACILAALLLAPGAQAADLTVTLSDIRQASGILSVAVVDAAGFAGSARPVQGQRTTPSGESATLTFKDLAPGRYAVMVTHDENGNGRLDANALGMPLEGYGFSNNPRVMRKPTFDEAAFDLGDAGAQIAIELR